MSEVRSASFERPIKATLHVHLETGETWAATEDDLGRFNLVDRHAAYMAFDDAYSTILGDAGLVEGDVTNAQLNPVRYLVETAIVFPDLIGHRDQNGWDDVAAIERRLRTDGAGGAS